MKLLSALLLGICLSGCAIVGEERAGDDVRYILVYRVGFGYGYYYNGIWYPAPPRYIYGRPINWGPRYRPPPYGYVPPPPMYRPPRPIYVPPPPVYRPGRPTYVPPPPARGWRR